MEYYIIREGRQAGPFRKEELLINGLTLDTPVWTPGMKDWTVARDVPELLVLFDNSAFGAYAQEQYEPRTEAPRYAPGAGPAYEQQPPQQPGVPPYNWMTWAIVSTVLGFLFSCIGGVLGIIAIVYANKANTAFAYGDPRTGADANSTAKVLTIVALILSGIGLATVMAYCSVIGGLASVAAL